MSGTGTDDTVVLRLRPGGAGCLEALLLGAGPHLAAVTDVGRAGNGDLLLVLPAPAARLPQVLVGRPTAGEAVTVLVPLAQALQRLHDAGVAHGGVGADAVLLDADGSPYWAPPEAPTLLRRSGSVAFAERTAADVAAFRGLCAGVLGPLGLPVPEGRDLGALAVSLFAAAAPEPVRVRPAVEPVVPGPPSRLLPASPVPESTARRTTRDLLRPVLPALQGLRAVRRRIWVGLGAIVALLVGAVVLLPAGEQPPAASLPRTASPLVTPVPPTPVAPRALPARTALPALLVERERCLTAGSESCLRRVDAAGSPVLQADLTAVRAGTDAVRVDPGRLQPPSGDGGTALARAGRATVLAIREQDDWRLRDVVAEPPKG